MEDNIILANQMAVDRIYAHNTTDPEIVFYSNDMPLLTFGDKKIHLHIENFPEFEMDDFTREFFYIIEKNWGVKFEKK